MSGLVGALSGFVSGGGRTRISGLAVGRDELSTLESCHVFTQACDASPDEARRLRERTRYVIAAVAAIARVAARLDPVRATAARTRTAGTVTAPATPSRRAKA
ncbi:hypothetical protein, partial [Streptomyces neyagawaensis]